jgi:pimeloyl-ACP methyl ester carboxylesterase
MGGGTFEARSLSAIPPLAVPYSIPLILLSGAGADERMFEKLKPYLPEMVVPKWLPVRRGESLRNYAHRLADEIGRGRECFIGGASLGGFLAIEMLPYLNARACFLIGAVRSPAEMPFLIRLLRPAHALCRIIPFQLFLWLAGFLAATFGPILPRRLREFLRLGGSLDEDFFRWSLEAVLLWGVDGPPPPSSTPVFQIQGQKDRVLPAKLTHPNEIIPRGGHVIALSHPKQVADFILRHMAALTSADSAA